LANIEVKLVLLSWYGKGFGCREHSIFHPSLEEALVMGKSKQTQECGKDEEFWRHSAQ
jgi:hypothetical protein